MDINNAYQLIIDKLTLWAKDLIRLLPNIALAALILADQLLEVKSQAIIPTKKAYDTNGIMIPFPIRTVDFGSKRGVLLTDMIKDK